MWTALWDTVEAVTGRRVLFKFLHGRGLRAIILDGCEAQIEGCGINLIRRNSLLSGGGVTETDPKLIVLWIIRTCEVHLDR
jgi:hypothetical protein